jgi:hypothetical protein
MRMRTLLIALLGAAVLLGLGCEKSVIGPGGETVATYQGGTLRSNVSADINATYEAAEKAVKDLNLTVIQANSSQLGATIIARDMHDRKIEIGLTSLTEKATKMTVNTGSEASANRIYREIMANLPPMTAQAQAAAQP